MIPAILQRAVIYAALALTLTGLAAAAESKYRWTGDFDKLADRRVIRALVPYSKTYYFLDKGRPMGITYDSLMKFEKMLNKNLKTRHLKLHVVVIPTPRDRLLKDLISGIGDIAAGNLTITGLREKQVEFSDPLLTGVREILVTGPSAPPVKDLEDLAGKRIHVRKSSSYYESLTALNREFRKKRLKQVTIAMADEFFEDEDLLEMVNTGMIPMVVVDSHKAEFWAKILDGIVLHPEVVVRHTGNIGWAVRKNSPKLLGQINAFVKTSKKGTLLGNIMFERYLENTDYLRTVGKGKTFGAATKAFQKYGKTYDIDWLLLKAMAFQESGIQQDKKSHRGAVGIMQILPSTARDPNVNIKDIHKLENNVHAGAKYLRFLMNRYFSDSKIHETDRLLLALGAYNAGPRQMISLRQEASTQGLDPNVWFKNVEVAAAQKIGRETVQYVSNIFKYYLAYQRFYRMAEEKGGS